MEKDLAEKLEINHLFKAPTTVSAVKRQDSETARDQPIICQEKLIELEFFKSHSKLFLIDQDNIATM